MELLDGFRSQIEQELREIVTKGSTPLLDLDTMLAYHMGFSDQYGNLQDSARGKYMRPLFCLAICVGLGGKPDMALPAAASLELAHRTSLIFDDIQDNGRERNKQPTVWAIWGVNQAINAGFALSSYAHLALHRMRQRGVPSSVILEVWRELESAVIGLCQGQFMDISFMDKYELTVDDYLEMVRGKTGALFGAACEIGAMIAPRGRPVADLARDFGMNMGIAFQIHDDYLGVWGDEALVGKTANDLLERKRSLPLVLALEQDLKWVKRWLELEYIGKRSVKGLTAWMERKGIREKVNEIEARYIRKARASLKALSLQKEWHDQFEEVLSFLSERKI
ncbi:hypothetical protein ES703_23558 [subsurface metagenome]